MQVDTLGLRVTHTLTTTTANPPILTTQTVSAPTGTVLPSRGFWGAIITKGGQRSNGDQFSPGNNGGTTANPDFDPDGHSYEVKIVGGGGRVEIFDAVVLRDRRQHIRAPVAGWAPAITGSADRRTP